METKYFVCEAYRGANGGGWSYSLKGMYGTLADAKQAYHARMAAIVKPSNDICMVIIYDSFGNKVDSDFVTTYVEPEPNEEGDE